jgi:uncharacterized radical SAM superfamily Fe-S cluster-containing enzyme
MIIKESDLQKGLPKVIQSLCPECANIIDATLVDRDGKVMVEKTCPEHGYFEDIYFSDVGLFHVMEGYAHDGTGVDNPFYPEAEECPTDCGLCQMHLSHTVLANVDLTNRCNLKCPICFANANASGFIVEPTFDEVVEMLAVLRRNSPVATPSVQFAGGEPTVYPYFLEAVKAAHELGFAQIQVATNGVRMAQEPGFTQAMTDAGVHTVYLQFDGFDDEMYKEVRGKPMVAIKQRAVETVREAKPNMSICLVPTLVNTVNDHIVGDIVQYAIDNSDVIHAVNFQPVAFTGRIDKTELARKRFTLSDLVHRLVDQTDFLKEEHFFPVPSVSVFSELASVWQNDPKVAFTSHPHCGLATFIFIDEHGTPIPVNEFVDVPRLLADVEKAAENIGNAKVKAAAKVKLLKFKLQEGKYINKKKSPGGIGMAELLSAFYEDADKGALADFAWRSMMIGGMHFMDRYNYDVDRVKRCTIHYAVPDGRIIPFCAYNSGPVFRDELEKKYALSNEGYRALREKEEVLMEMRRRTGQMVSPQVLETVPAAMEKYVKK